MRILSGCLVLTALNACSSSWTPKPIPRLETRCFSESQPIPWSYCLYRYDGSKSRDLVYHFHGRNAEASWWNDADFYSGSLYRLWTEKRREAPVVASVSFGPLWLLTEGKELPHGGLHSIFVRKVVPEVERRLPGPVGKRMLLGESMGGLNALMTGLKSKGTFSKVASLCPPLPTVSPFASWKDRYDYFRRSSASWKRALMLLYFSSRFYRTEETWRENDPLVAALHFDPRSSPAIYLSCGIRDEWGCMEGSRELVSRIRTRHGRVDWRERPGGHCDVDAESLAAFFYPGA